MPLALAKGSAFSASLQRVIVLYEKMRETLPPITNEQAISHPESLGGMSLHDFLIAKNLGFIVGSVQRYATSEEEAEDMFQTACMAIMEAATKYDSGRNTKFITYAAYWIRSHLVDLSMKWNNMNELSAERGTHILEYIMSILANPADESNTLEEAAYEEEEDDEAPSPKAALLQQMHKAIHEVLPPHLKTVVLLWLEGRTTKEIGEMTGHSPANIRKYLMHARRILKAHFETHTE